MRPSTTICVHPVPTRDASFAVDEPFGNCLCEISPPPVLPDNLNAQTDCNLDADAYTPFKHPEFNRVDCLSEDFEETKFAANSTFNELCEEILRSNSLKDQKADIRNRIATLTSENESPLKRTFELTEDVSTRTASTSAHRHLPALQRLFFHHLQQLPLTTNPDEIPHILLVRAVGCTPSSSPEKKHKNIKFLLQQLHPDKNRSVPSSVSKCVPLVTLVKTISLNPNLLSTYRCCSRFGVNRQQNGLRTCKQWDPYGNWLTSWTYNSQLYSRDANF